MNRHRQRLITGVVKAAIVCTALVLATWASPKSPSAQGGLCPFDPTDADTSAAPVAFSARVASPFTYDFDTGYKPTGLGFGLKAFYYSSAGELDVKASGDLLAVWQAGHAYPGNSLPITLKAQGIRPDSRWMTDGGLRFGALYKYDYEVGFLEFKKEDYIPKIPHFDISWPCDTTFTPFALTNPELTCTKFWADGALPCFLNIVLGDNTMPGPCVNDLTWSPGVSLDYCFNDDPSDTSKVGFSDWCFFFYPHPSTKLFICGTLGFCTTFSMDGDSLIDVQGGGQAITQDNGSVSFNVQIPCDFAQATDDERVFEFTRGPFRYRGNLLFSLVAKLQPVIKPCFVEFAEVTLNIGSAFCALILPNPFYSATFALPFNEKNATFQVPIVDPEVCDIEPGSGSVAAGDTVSITWGTTWDAPDNCNCRAKVHYRTRPKGVSTWGSWIQIADTLNTGILDWGVPVFAACTEAQIRVQFFDPSRNFLHELIGGKFFIDLALPTISTFPNPVPGIRVCAGDFIPVSWTATDLCTLVSVDVRLSRQPGDGFPILMSSTANPFGDNIFWQVPFKMSGTEQARVMLEVSDGVHVARDTSGTFAIVNPSGIFAPSDTLDVTGLGLFMFDMGGFNAQMPVDPCSGGAFNMNFRYAIGGPVPLGDFLPSGDIEPDEEGTDTVLTDLDVGAPPVLFNLHFETFVPVGSAQAAAAALSNQVDTLVTTMTSLNGAFPGAIAEHRLLIVGIDFASGIGDGDAPRPQGLAVRSVYPNPFNPEVQIRLDIPTAGSVKVDIYDVNGRLVRRLANEPMERGERVVRWNGRNDVGRTAGSGVYFAVVKHGDQVRAAKLVLLK